MHVLSTRYLTNRKGYFALKNNTLQKVNLHRIIYSFLAHFLFHSLKKIKACYNDTANYTERQLILQRNALL